MQMLKLCPFQIPSHIHLNGGGRMDRKIHADRLGHNHQNISDCKRLQPVKRI